MKTRDVVIAGGGIPGLVLGILLVQAGIDACVIDPSPFPAKGSSLSGRTSALMEGSLDILAQAGISEQLVGHATDLRVMTITDSIQTVKFSAAELGREKFGSNIVNSFLIGKAVERLKKLSPTSLLADRLGDYIIGNTSIEVLLSSGASLKTRLLVGSDGRNSRVRKIAYIPVREYVYDQMAITALISHSKPHHFTSTEFHRPGGPFTFVPMTGSTSSLAWLDRREDAEKFLRQGKSDFEKTLQDLSQDVLGTISLLSPPEAWPLRLMQANAYTAQRVALIAEAAHVLSPIGAQGLNLSLRDTQALSDSIISTMRLGLDPGNASMLAEYERTRATDIRLRVIGTHALNQMAASHNGFVQNIRQLGLKTISGIPSLRNLAMQEGLSPHYKTVSGRTTRAKVKTSTQSAPA